MAKKESKPRKGSVPKLCGITEKRADEITKTLSEEMRNAKNWHTIIGATIKNAKIKTAGEGMYLGWIFRIDYVKMNDPLAHIFEHMAAHRH